MHARNENFGVRHSSGILIACPQNRTRTVCQHAYGTLFGMCPPNSLFEAPFFREHPEFRCQDYDGSEISHLSYAFAEVRRYIVSLLKDIVGYNIDG